MSLGLKEWQEKEFNQFLKSSHFGVIEFGAKWCHACALTEPMVAEVALKYPKISFSKIDVNKNPGLASRMGVMSLPNILIINDGKVINQVIGATTAKVLEEKIKNIK